LIWWQILTRLDPFTPRPEANKTKEGLAKYIIEGNRPKCPKSWPANSKKLIKDCWSADQDQRPTFRSIIEMWDTLVLDFFCLQSDHNARSIVTTLWKDVKSKLDFSVFVETFMQVCDVKLKEKDIELIESICKESLFDDTVSFQRFCYMVGWFGPLDTGCVQFLARMKDALSQPFFHSFLSDQQSNLKLTNFWESHSEKYSYYLVKFSLDSLGEFQLCYLDAVGAVRRIPIRNESGMLVVDSEKRYTDWSKLKSAIKKFYHIGKHLPRKH